MLVRGLGAPDRFLCLVIEGDSSPPVGEGL